MGPVFHAIEKEIFKHKAFIKHVPILERPRYIMEHIHQAGANYASTDHTAFEAHITREVMEVIEFQLYDYMTSNLAIHKEFMESVKAISQVNHCRFKTVDIFVEGSRMSGEMCTSLGNGYTNLVLIDLIAEELKWSNVRRIVEGDDGLISYYGRKPEREDFLKFGFDIKMEYHESVSDASFCGLVFAPESEQIIANPRKYLNSFGWLDVQYVNAADKKLKALLKCKALSLLYQFSGCPILGSLCRYFLRVTSDVRWKIGKHDMFQRERILNNIRLLKDNWNKYLDERPSFETRALFDRLYSISLDEQKSLESYLDSQQNLVQLDHPVIDKICYPIQAEYNFKYTAVYDKSNLYYPCLYINQSSHRDVSKDWGSYMKPYDFNYLRDPDPGYYKMVDELFLQRQLL